MRRQNPFGCTTNGAPGITPAGAGTCSFCDLLQHCTKDHPRGCGDMIQEISIEHLTGGSPPRVRGHGTKLVDVHAHGRITPAGAGICGNVQKTFANRWDHPRGCGDMSSSSRRVWPLWGSPPRVRGHAAIVSGYGVSDRITPAGAGTCRDKSSAFCHVADHPRGCGDMVELFGFSQLLAGSPPRVRGHVRQLVDRRRGIRITPAGAGTCLPRR